MRIWPLTGPPGRTRLALMILIIGAGSRTGRELVRLLRAAGTPVRLLTRSAPGPDEVTGDLADPASLDQAMKGADAVFLLSSAAPGELGWHRNAIEAAARAGVGHLVRSSILGADPASPAREARISMVDARDVAAAAARVLAGAPAGQARDVTGPEALSHADAAAKLAASLGRPVRYVPVDDAAARSGMLAAGIGEWLADGLIELYQDYRRPDGYAARVHGTVRDLTGAEPRTLEQALADP